ncbi:MAG TPA: putative peptidoglycan glycosyltransferase FtsW [Bryobacteraceae bacterium]|nr:putative peptidoglycan glycosyltransferase FtsW [Bryobacteraceae bacterium]
MSKRVAMDWTLFLTVAVMVAAGLIMIYSASSITAESRYSKPPYYFIAMQLGWAIVGFIALMLFRRFDYRKLRRPEWAFGPLAVVLFLLPVAYFVDPRHRWIPLGIGNIQPSEIAKPAMVIFLAYFLTWRQAAINDARFTLRPAALLLGVLFLLVAVADLGTAVVLAVTAVAMFYIAGLDRRFLITAGSLALVCMTLAIAAKPYRLRRVVEMVDPTYEKVDRYDVSGKIKPYILSSASVSDTGYQARQAKIAHGSGGVFGLGLMHGRQKHFYLPESHTDFIYAVIGEELGLWGTAAVLFGYFIIIWRGIRIYLLTPDEFGRMLALGLTIAIGFQALFNITVVLGLGPTKGIPLPMISYGGSALMTTLASLGILLNISENVG